MNPTFSIIIPVYNVAPYLRECLDSILAQTYTAWEAICVDDGSTDGSGAILDECAAKDSRFRILHQANAGSSAARNAGLDVATGEWIWFVDADDKIVPNATDKFLALDSKADVNLFGARICNPDGSSVEKRPADSGVVTGARSIDDLIENLWNGSLDDIFGWTWNKFIRRCVIEKSGIRFDSSISFYEDEVFMIRVAEHCESFSTIGGVFYHYRKLDSGLTARGIPDPFVLAKAFVNAGGDFKRDSISRLVYNRVNRLLRDYIMKTNSKGAAFYLLQFEQSMVRLFPINRRGEIFISRISKYSKTLAAALAVTYYNRIK